MEAFMKEKIKALEDLNNPFFGPNIKLLKLIGLYPVKNTLLNVVNFYFKLSITLFFSSQAIDLILLSVDRNNPADFNVVLTNLKYTLLAGIISLKWRAYVKNEKTWNEIFDYINEADLEERSLNDEHSREVVKSYTKYSRLLTYGYVILTNVCAMGAGILPIVKYGLTPNYKEKLLNGTLPFPYSARFWVPFDKNAYPLCWVILAWHLTCAYYAGNIISVYDSNMLVIMKFFEKKLHLLQYRCSLLYKEKDMSTEVLTERIKDCHIQHNNYLK